MNNTGRPTMKWPSDVTSSQWRDWGAWNYIASKKAHKRLRVFQYKYEDCTGQERHNNCCIGHKGYYASHENCAG